MRQTDTVVLKKGTWFQMRNNEEALLGEIVDFQQDEENPELYWLKCKLHFDYNAEQEMDQEKLYSSRDFETFRDLQLYTEDAGEDLLENAIDNIRERGDRDEREMPNIGEELARLAGEAMQAGIGRLIPDTVENDQRRPVVDPGPSRERRRPRERVEGPGEPTHAEPREGETREEPVYIRRTEYNDNQPLPSDDSERFKTPLGSGDMKSIVSLFNVNSSASWETINTIIEETGHLLLSYTNSSTREKIIQTKLNFLAAHDWVTLEVKSLYELEFKDKITKAVYLGGDHWLMNPEENNDIDGLKDHAYIKIDMDRIQNFSVKKLDDSSLVLDIGTKVMSHVNPSDLQYLSDRGSQEIFCMATGERAQLTKKDISKSWEKALVYDYYLGGSLDLRLSIKDFNEVDSVKKLATVREDAPVLEALAA